MPNKVNGIAIEIDNNRKSRKMDKLVAAYETNPRNIVELRSNVKEFIVCRYLKVLIVKKN